MINSNFFFIAPIPPYALPRAGASPYAEKANIINLLYS